MCYILTSMDSETSTLMDLSRHQHKEVIEKMDGLTEVMQGGLKTLYLVPVMLLYMLVTGVLFWFDKIPIWVWLPMNLIIMTPFFGEGVRMVLPLFPSRNDK